MIELRKVYDQDKPGYIVLVDRIWPRGISKEKAPCYEWMKEIAPGYEL